jgi:hypothetical protein
MKDKKTKIQKSTIDIKTKEGEPINGEDYVLVLYSVEEIGVTQENH